VPEYLAPAVIAHGRETTENGGVITTGGVPAGANGGIDPTPGWLAASFTPNMVRTHETIGLYANTSTGDTALEQPAAFRAALDAMNANAGRVSLPIAGGSDIVVPECCYAGPSAAGLYYFDPSDIGVGPGQVNPNGDLVDAAQLVPHPSVFVRKPDRVRAIYSQQREDTPLPVIPGTPPSVVGLRVIRPPTFSAWVIGVDGHKVFCGVAHPAGSDLRRPRDIWEQVWVPLIAGSNSTAAAIDNLEWWGGSGPVATIYRRGILTRLAYLDYARFWAARDLDTTPNFEIVWSAT
jgi:hypothetical protein